MNIDRKEAIKRTALLMGGLVFAPSALGVLNGCKARPGVDWNPRYFNRERARLVTVLSDIIIPETDTPGASQAGVPAFIEEMVFTFYTEDVREQFLSGIDSFNDLARESHGNRFAELDPDMQHQFADEQNRHALEGVQLERPFFLVMKELTIMGYFTSEAGAKETLRYEKVPGYYEGCIPFEDIGKTWAT